MPHSKHSFRTLSALAFCVAALASPPGARGEKADRFKPINVEADRDSKIDLINQFTVFNGNVVITKGTLVIRAARVEVRQSPDGYHSAIAFGSPSQHATYRQKRDAPDEWIEGDAERLEYDGKSDVIRFVNAATVRRLRGTTAADEISGNLVTYDSNTEVFDVSGGNASAANPGGRVRAVLTPREGSSAAAEAASAAGSGPALRRSQTLPPPATAASAASAARP